MVNAVGYPIERHRIETSDGFKITMHRIPFSYNKVLEKGHPTKTVLLVHGILCSSTMWVANMNGNETSLAFLLSDAGYDVWMLNMRGTAVSLKHKQIQINNPKFWDFSWHEMGMEDVPKAIDYILDKTKRQTLNYVCHSQGCTALLVALSMKPEYNEKVSSAYFLAPAVFMSHIKGVIPSVLRGRRNNALFNTLQTIGWNAVQGRNSTFSEFVRQICEDRRTISLCSEAFENMIGPMINKNMDKNQFLLFIFKYIGDNASLKQFTHYIQLMRSGKFQMFDYGLAKNREIYQEDTPPQYNLTQITIPISIMRTINDPLSAKKDIKTLTSQLTNARSVRVMPGNHIDYVFDPVTITVIKDHMLSVMESDVEVD